MAITIPVSVDTESADREFAKLASAMTEMAKAFTEGAKKAVKPVNQLTEAEKEAAEAAKKAKKQLDDAAKGMEDLGDVAGLPVDKLKKLSSGFQAAANAMTPAQLGMVAFGGAAVAATAAAAASVAVVYKLGEAVISLVQSSAQAIPGLKELEKASGVSLVSAETVTRVQRADAAIASVGTSASAVGAVIAGQLGPSIDSMSTLIVAANLALKDFLEKNTQIVRVVLDLGVAIVDYMIAPIKGAILSLGAFLSAAARLSEVMGSDMAGSLKETANSLLLFGATDFADNVKSMTGAVSDYIPAANALIDGQVKVNKTMEKSVDTTGKLRDALFELQNLVAEGQLAPGSKDIRNTSVAMAGLTTKLNGLLASYGVSIPKSQDFEQALLDLKLQAIDLDIAFSQGKITQAEYAQGQVDNKAAVDATTEAIQKQAEATKKAAEDAVKSIQDTAAAQEGAINQAQGGLASIVGMIAGPVAGAIVGLVMNFGQTVSDLADELMSLPKILTDIPTQAAGLVTTILQDVVPGLLKALPDIATSLLAMVPTVIYGVVDAIPLIITAFVEAIPTLIQAVIMGLPGIVVAVLAIIPLLIVNFGKVLKTEFLKGFRWVTEQGIPKLVRSFADGMRDLFNSLIEQIVGTFKDIFSRDGSSKSRQSYGDTPGMRRAGPNGMNLKASAGDYFAFARTKKGLVDQALEGMGGSSQPAMAAASAPVLVLSDHARQFDGLSYRIRRMGGGASQDIAVRQRYANSRGY